MIWWRPVPIVTMRGAHGLRALTTGSRWGLSGEWKCTPEDILQWKDDSGGAYTVCRIWHRSATTAAKHCTRLNAGRAPRKP